MRKDEIEIYDIDIKDLVGTNLEPSYDPTDEIIDRLDYEEATKKGKKRLKAMGYSDKQIEKAKEFIEDHKGALKVDNLDEFCDFLNEQKSKKSKNEDKTL
ncbi:MAG: hypothetical protein ACI4TI_01685 [Christensenellales bacterium]